MKYICPLIVVENMAQSRDFYQRVLGQSVRYDFGENVAYEGDFAIHQKDHYQGLLSADQPVEVGPVGHAHELYFETDDLDHDLQLLQSEGVTFVHGVMAQPWGQRVARFYDPDRHIIELGERMEAVVIRFHRQGLTSEEIVQRTSMPEAFVQAVLNSEGNE